MSTVRSTGAEEPSREAMGTTAARARTGSPRWSLVRVIQLGVSLGAVVMLLLLRQAGGFNIRQHQVVVDHLRQLKQLDTMLNQDLLKLRYGLLPAFDPVVQTLVELRSLRHELTTGRLAIYHRGQREIDRAVEAYTELVTRKTDLIERFAEQNKRFEEGLRQLPVSAEQLTVHVRDRNPNDPLQTLLAALLPKVLLYNLTVEPQIVQEIHQLVGTLVALEPRYPADLANELTILIAYVQWIVQEKAAIDASVSDFVSMPSVQRLDELYQTYMSHYDREMRRADQYRLSLYCLCIVLLASLAYVMLKLRERNHLYQERAQELIAANAHLGVEIAERQRVERRLTVQHGVIRVLAEAMTETQGVPKALQTICEHFGWAAGIIWGVDRTTDRLRCQHVWSAADRQLAAVAAAVSQLTYAPGVGVCGRVWMEGQPLWLEDTAAAAVEMSMSLWTQAGIRLTVVVPIWVGTEITGVLECRGCAPQVQDPKVLQLVTALANHIGQFMWRVRLEQQGHAQTEQLERSNAALAHRERVLQGLLQEFQSAKERLERQTAALQSTNIKLKELAVLKDEFVAKVSHELRTPLTSIKEGLSLILDGALGNTTADQRDFLMTMDGDLDRLTELVNNMLDISKIEAGRMRLARTPVDLRALIQSLVRTYQPIFGHRTVRLELTEVPASFADANRILQVFANLLSNAIKFTSESGVIAFHTGTSDGLVSVALEDNGPGIAPEDLPKLFQKFSQVGPQQGMRIRGTGLGLVVCKELVELHGGRIDVVSELERGTTFTVWLPVYTDDLALRESFHELLGGGAGDGSQSAISLIACRPAEEHPDGDGAVRRARLQQVAVEIRRQVHQGDIVLVVEQRWIVILAATDARGVAAMIKRLKGLLGGEQFCCGAAIAPADGDEPMRLLTCAKARVELMAPVGEPSASNGPRAPEPSGPTT